MDPHKEGRDRFILSKGHCSETLYTIFSDLGAYTQDYMVEHFENLDQYKFGMHSNRKKCPQIEVSAGSLGHGLPIAVGYALGARYRKENYRVMVMIGDGEFDEGTNWEALMAGGHYKLNNLVCILDKNQLQMTGNTRQIMNIDPVADKVRAFAGMCIEHRGRQRYGAGLRCAGSAAGAGLYQRSRPDLYHQQHREGQGRKLHGRQP